MDEHIAYPVFAEPALANNLIADPQPNSMSGGYLQVV